MAREVGAAPLRAEAEPAAKEVPMQLTGRLRGVVKTYDRSAGYGFVDCAQVRLCFSRDAFLHKREAERARATSPGIPVSFYLRVSHAGKPQAHAVVAERCRIERGMAPWSAMNDRSFVGILKSYNADEGYGFIACDDLVEQSGHDVFLHSSQKGSFSVGARVRFRIDVSRSGRPRARDLENAGKSSIDGGAERDAQLRAESADALAAPSRPRSASLGRRGLQPAATAQSSSIGGKAGAAFDNSVSSTADAQSTAQVDARTARKGLVEVPGIAISGDCYVGVIKSFDAELGYGFIACDKLIRQCGRDAFLHRSRKGTFPVGAVVRFRIDVSKKGHPQARDLQDAGVKLEHLGVSSHNESTAPATSWNPTVGMTCMDGGAAKHSAAEAGAVGAEHCGAERGVEPRAALADKAYVGVIKSYKVDEGYGFIACDELIKQCGRDAFLHRSQKGTFSVGARVCFRIDVSKKGHPQARDLQDAGVNSISGGAESTAPSQKQCAVGNRSAIVASAGPENLAAGVRRLSPRATGHAMDAGVSKWQPSGPSREAPHPEPRKEPPLERSESWQCRAPQQCPSPDVPPPPPPGNPVGQTSTLPPPPPRSRQKDVVVIEFEPGKAGMYISSHDGQVVSCVKGGQAERKGVLPSWVVVSVDDTVSTGPDIVLYLQSRGAAMVPYTVSFRMPEVVAAGSMQAAGLGGELAAATGDSDARKADAGFVGEALAASGVGTVSTTSAGLTVARGTLGPGRAKEDCVEEEAGASNTTPACSTSGDVATASESDAAAKAKAKLAEEALTRDGGGDVKASSWSRFADGKGGFWWWQETTGHWCLEDHSCTWPRFRDPNSGAFYRCWDDKAWFWEPTGGIKH